MIANDVLQCEFEAVKILRVQCGEMPADAGRCRPMPAVAAGCRRLAAAKFLKLNAFKKGRKKPFANRIREIFKTFYSFKGLLYKNNLKKKMKKSKS